MIADPKNFSFLILKFISEPFVKIYKIKVKKDGFKKEKNTLIKKLGMCLKRI